jgi:hypothetical protein
MPQSPPVNPDVNDIADRAKHGYAIGTRLLAAVQYRLARLAGTGRLDPDESMRLQHVLADIWWALYSGTTQAVRDQETDDNTWDEADNTYSDGRAVMVQSRIEPVVDWEYSRFLWGEGAVLEHRRGTTSHISPPHEPKDDCGVAIRDEVRGRRLNLVQPLSPKDLPGQFAALAAQLRMCGGAPGDWDDWYPYKWAEDAIGQVERLNDYDDGSPVL